MPTFEFACEKCSHEFEELVLRRDEVITCPQCGSDHAKKLLSSFAVTGGARLKGGGGSCGTCRPSAGKCGGCCGH
jgi:putative FmdB family regulatory protein